MNATNGQEPWTLLRLINWTRDHFTSHQVDSPRLAAEVLLAHVLGCERMALYTRFGEVPASEQLAAFRELVKRAAEHEPVAYLVGHRDFYSLQLAVTPEVLIPRSETELVVDKAVEYLRGLGRPGACWDICTGSGAVAIAVAANVPDVTVLATDISEAATDLAGRNAAAHDVAGRVDVAAADLLAWPAGRDGPRVFDVITANPPYVTESDMADLPPEVRREPRQALAGGADGLDFIRRILTDAPDILADGGLLAMEIGYNQAATVWDLLLQIDRYEQAQFFRDSAGIERVLVAYKKQ
jgi:release factor glutamine methyltransferase